MGFFSIKGPHPELASDAAGRQHSSRRRRCEEAAGGDAPPLSTVEPTLSPGVGGRVEECQE